VTIVNSTIGGTLFCYSNRLVIEGSTIDTIDLRCSGGVSIRSGGISLLGVTNNVFINGVSLSQLQAQKSFNSEKKDGSPKQILELRNCTIKNIIF